MDWIEPKYSKECVRKAGKLLLSISESENNNEFHNAALIFFNWRAAHASPTQIMLDLLRKNAIRIDRNAVVVQRLKRVPSIYNKLAREGNMSLNRMEDIGGCRAVLQNSKQVYSVCKILKESRTKNILFRERDYISFPKESGYRGIHLIFKYNGSKDSFRGLHVELQIRSKVQHSWATAVEVVGAFTKQALKASMGDAHWLEFFKYASVEFSKLEGYEPDKRFQNLDTFAKLCEMSSLVEVNHRLNAFNIAVQLLTSNTERSAGYYILLLDMEKNLINVSRFLKSQITEATEFYDSQELKHKDDQSKDVVMVSAKSLKDLKKAYPNYFLDTIEFQKNLEKVKNSYQ